MKIQKIMDFFDKRTGYFVRGKEIFDSICDFFENISLQLGL